MGNIQSIGDYEYSQSDLIGHGGFGLVYKGCHRLRKERPLAIKCISKKVPGGINQILDKEFSILKKLHHQNIVQLFDFKISGQNVYLIMEYCNGGDMANYMKIKGTLCEDTIQLFFRQIATAMAFLHSKEVVHRDLKPQNLILSHKSTNPTPQEITLKIADFGVARYLQGNTLAETLCGSPLYMAPEVLTSQYYDAKTDLWSIGIMIYECLTGDIPFEVESLEELCNMYEKHKNLSPTIPVQTSKHLHHLLLELLKVNVKQRISFADFFNHPFFAMTVQSTIVQKVVVWETMSVVHNAWFTFEPMCCQDIERAYQKFLANATSQTEEYQSRKDYHLNFKTMAETNQITKFESPVRRLIFRPSYAAAHQIRWEWDANKKPNPDWFPYPADVNEYIEQNYQLDKSMSLDLSQHFADLDYTLDFLGKNQKKNRGLLKRRNIRRTLLQNKYPVEIRSSREIFILSY